MPTAPIIHSTQDAGVGYVEIDFVNSGTGDHNEVWRMTPTENSGQFIKIADPVLWRVPGIGDEDSQFLDLGVAHGKTYIYYIVGVDSSGSEAASATIQQAFALQTAMLHPAQRALPDTAVAANGDYLNLLALIDFAPYQQSRKLNTVSRITANSTRPSIGVGSVRHLQVNPSVLIPYDNDNRATLRAIFKSPYYACLRDALGGKYFGRLVAPSENYGATFTTPGLVFESLSFSEAI